MKAELEQQAFLFGMVFPDTHRDLAHLAANAVFDMVLPRGIALVAADHLAAPGADTLLRSFLG